MNKFLFKITSLFSLLILVGCDDFLNKEVVGYSTDENYYNTQYKLQAALNATYDVLQSDLFNQCEWRFGDACADDVWGADESLASQMGQLVNFRFTTSNEWIQNRYVINYKGIRRANQVIANVQRVNLSVGDYISYKAIREILGQAKFLRALFYFNLVKTYGGVPIRPEVESVDSLVIPRSSVSEVYAYIEKDLREAAVMLDARYMGNDAGKASCGAVVALLMKILMYQTIPGEESDKWKEMVRLGEFFVEGQPLTYGEILHYDPDKEDWEVLRKRLLFKPKELNAATDPYETSATQLPALQNAYSIEYKDYYGKSINYYDQFFQTGEFCLGSVFEIVFKESADGSTGDINEGSSIFSTLYSSSPVMWSTEGIIQELFLNDPRRSFMIGHLQFAPDGEVCPASPGRNYSLKWYTPLKDRPQYSGDNAKNRRLIRYAEVVLMYAEALNECGFGAKALEQLNKSKKQANLINNSSTLYIGGGYGYMRDQIWQERRVEFCYEWDRFFDLVRQKRAAKIIKNYGAGRANKRGYYFREGVNEIFPIPQSEIDISNGIVVQNPGY